MTSDEAYERKRKDLAKLSFINSFLALREAFKAGWEGRAKELEDQKQHGGITQNE